MSAPAVAGWSLKIAPVGCEFWSFRSWSRICHQVAAWERERLRIPPGKHQDLPSFPKYVIKLLWGFIDYESKVQQNTSGCRTAHREEAFCHCGKVTQWSVGIQSHFLGIWSPSLVSSVWAQHQDHGAVRRGWSLCTWHWHKLAAGKCSAGGRWDRLTWKNRVTFMGCDGHLELPLPGTIWLSLSLVAACARTFNGPSPGLNDFAESHRQLLPCCQVIPVLERKALPGIRLKTHYLMLEV